MENSNAIALILLIFVIQKRPWTRLFSPPQASTQSFIEAHPREHAFEGFPQFWYLEAFYKND